MLIERSRAARCAAPTDLTRHLPLDKENCPLKRKARAGLGPAPTADIEAFPPFRRGRSQTGPRAAARAAPTANQEAVVFFS